MMPWIDGTEKVIAGLVIAAVVLIFAAGMWVGGFF